MIKKAYSIMMTFEVSDEEKRQAEKAIRFFKKTGKLLDIAVDHLNIMYIPFKDNSDISPEDLDRNRADLRSFRDKVVDNFNDFKKGAFYCIEAMELFGSDTQTSKFMKTFISSIDQLQSLVNKFVDLFEDLKSKDFATECVQHIKNILDQSEDIAELIDERIRPYIQNNILAKSWVDEVSTDIQKSIEKQTPLLMQLQKEREKQLSQVEEPKEK